MACKVLFLLKAKNITIYYLEKMYVIHKNVSYFLMEDALHYAEHVLYNGHVQSILSTM
jgi:hypothetical protein